MNSSIEISVLSPETLISLVACKPPEGVLRVRGKVTRLTPYPANNPIYYYGTLESIYGDGSLEFKCPRDSAPSALYQAVIIEGAITYGPFRRNRGVSGIELTLNGSCIGVLDLPDESKTALHPSERFEAKTPLKTFIEKNGIDGIGIIGSDIALNDIKSTMDFDPKYLQFMKSAPVSDMAKMLEIVRQLKPRAIIFSRGGDDASLQIWDKPEFIEELLALEIPFYTALGHAHRLCLADYYADQAFLTPSELGNSLKNIITEIHKFNDLKKSLNKKHEQNTELEKDLVAFQVNHQGTVGQLNGEISALKKDNYSLNKRITKQLWIKRLFQFLCFAMSIALILVAFRWHHSDVLLKSTQDKLQEQLQRSSVNIKPLKNK